MITFNDRNSNTKSYEIYWSKNNELKFIKKSKVTEKIQRLEEMGSELEKLYGDDARELLDVMFKFHMKEKRKVMEDWSKNKSEKEDFKKEILPVLEKIAGEEHKKDDVCFVIDKDTWKKLKDGTASDKDFRKNTLF